jgi:CubicO group peptidase (beta-lactamase class C family)
MHRVSKLAVCGFVLLLALVSSPVPAAEPGAEIDRLLGAYHALGQLNGSALVARDGKVLLSRGYGLANMEWGIPNAPDTKFRLGSITKQFTSMLVMQLVAEGKLATSTTVAEALPYYRKDAGGAVTIHQLLSHTSGIPSYTSNPDFRRLVSRNPFGTEEFVTSYCSGDLEFAPGSKYRYSNSGYFILGAIVEHVAGKSYEQVLRERILGPVGMKDTGYDHWETVLAKRAAGYERVGGAYRTARYLDMSVPGAAGGLYSTVEDLLRWDQALYGDALLPAELKRTMLTPVLEEYAYGWRVAQAPVGPGKQTRTLVSHGGGIDGFTTLITRVIDERILIVTLNNTGDAPHEAIAMGILDIVHGRTPPAPKRPLGEELLAVIEKDGAEAGVRRYRELKATQKDVYDFGEPVLNTVGYTLLARGRTDAAIAVFRLNADEFPQSGNVYDSLGEAQMAAGAKEDAIRSYARSLQLDPSNRNAVDQLAKLIAVAP